MNHRQENDPESLQIDRRRGRMGLKNRVLESAPNRSGEAISGLRLAVEALGASAMKQVKTVLRFTPPRKTAAGAKECRTVVNDLDGLAHLGLAATVLVRHRCAHMMTSAPPKCCNFGGFVPDSVPGARLSFGRSIAIN